MLLHFLVALLGLLLLGLRLTRYRNMTRSTLDLGPWAVITGGTDGIGKEYAKQLASRGVNIVLISRSFSKLGDLSIQLSAEFGVQVRTIVADFTHGLRIYSEIAVALEGLEVATLINNVGMTYPSPCYLHELDEQSVLQLLNCNIMSVTMMTKLVLPIMAKNGRGFIVNVGSMAAEVPFPFLSVYAASKAYVDKLSQDIGLEYGSKGIFVQSLIPAWVATKMSKIREGSSFLAPNPEQFVISALDSLGKESRTPGYYSHRYQLWWFRIWGLVFRRHFDKWNFNVMNSWRIVALLKR